MHTHPGCTSSVDTTVADDQLHNFLKLGPPRCAETHSTGSHSAANRRAVPRHSSLSKWRRWYTMPASSSGHSRGSWISLIPWTAESLTVFFNGPRERIPSSSRNYFCSEPSSSFWRLRCRRGLRLWSKNRRWCTMTVSSSGPPNRLWTAFFRKLRKGPWRGLLSVPQERIQLSKENAASAANRRADSQSSRAAENCKKVDLALIGFMEGFNRNEAPRSLGHRSTSRLVHPRWRRRASMLTRSAVSQVLSADAR